MSFNLDKVKALFSTISFYLGTTIIILFIIELLSFFLDKFVLPLVTTGERNFESALFSSLDLGR